MIPFVAGVLATLAALSLLLLFAVAAVGSRGDVIVSARQAEVEVQPGCWCDSCVEAVQLAELNAEHDNLCHEYGL